MSEKLLPCPFCGSTNISNSMGENSDGTPWPYIECDDCGASTEPDVWNARATDSSPTYYVLRRAVGNTTLHYEYDCVYDGWVLNQHYASLHGEKQFAKTRASKVGPCEIIPVKLMEVPHES